MKFNYGLIIGIICALAIGSYFYFSSDLNESEEVSEQESLDRQIEDAKDQAASRTDELNFDNAVIENNRAYCRAIVDDELRALCLEQVTNEEEPYEKTPVDNLNFENAVIENNTDYCTVIDNDTLRHQCLEEVTGEEVEFTVKPPSPTDQYYFDVATRRSNPQLCDSINNAQLKSECIAQASN